jgi:hypothetical protein
MPRPKKDIKDKGLTVGVVLPPNIVEVIESLAIQQERSKSYIAGRIFMRGWELFRSDGSLSMQGKSADLSDVDELHPTDAEIEQELQPTNAEREALHLDAPKQAELPIQEPAAVMKVGDEIRPKMNKRMPKALQQDIRNAKAHREKVLQERERKQTGG